jgi:CRISPR-associated endoribonuclease Cas6
MEMRARYASSTRLYALQLCLRPVREGTLMPFSGELVHGAFLHWLKATMPETTDWLHAEQKRRFFTCSNLHFKSSAHGLLKAQRENIHLPLDPRETYTVRLTLLLGDLFPLLHEALIPFQATHRKSEKAPFLQFGKQLFWLEDVQLMPRTASDWIGFTSLPQLIEQARQKHFDRQAMLALEFASLTTFNRGNNKTGYGSYPVMLPLPAYVLQNLLRRWEDLAPPEMVGLVQPERLEPYFQEDGVIIVDYDLQPHRVHFTTHEQRGFIGSCTYQLRGSDEQTTDEAPLTLRQQVYLLALLAFYTGIGYKTAMGMGQARLQPVI